LKNKKIMKYLTLTLTLILFITIGYSQSKEYNTYAYYDRSTGYVKKSPYPLTISNLSDGNYSIQYKLQDGVYSTEYDIKVEYVKKLVESASYEYKGDVTEYLYYHDNKVSTRTYETTLWTLTPLSKFIKETIGYSGYGLYDMSYVIRYRDFDKTNFDLYTVK
jgi:hypothetical protein